MGSAANLNRASTQSIFHRIHFNTFDGGSNSASQTRSNASFGIFVFVTSQQL
jgi:hypothetical protein